MLFFLLVFSLLLAMVEITKLLDSLSPSIKVFIGVMLGVQALAFAAWIVMMFREGSREKEKQN